jgi:hypothetical protein
VLAPGGATHDRPPGNGTAAEYFRRALAKTGVTPRRVTTDAAAAYPPAPARVLPGVEHQTGKLVQQRNERDQQHLKGRLKPIRGFGTASGARTIGQGHGFIRTLRGGFYHLGLVVARDPGVPQRPLLVRVWDELTAELLVGERAGRRGMSCPATGGGHRPALVPAQLNGTGGDSCRPTHASPGCATRPGYTGSATRRCATTVPWPFDISAWSESWKCSTVPGRQAWLAWWSRPRQGDDLDLNQLAG